MRGAAAEVLRQLHAALLKRQVVEEVHVSARAELILEAAGPGVEISEPPPEWGAILEEHPVPRLIRVIPLVRDLGMTPAGFGLALISLEIWTDGMELRYLQPAPPARRDLREALRDRGDRPLRDFESLLEGWGWEAWDDAGTLYEPRGGGGGDRDGVWVAVRRFRPTPPPEARHVTFVARGEEGEYAREVVDLSAG